MNTVERGLTSDETTWAMCAHPGVLSGYVVPFGHLILPLLVGVLNRSAYVRYHAREAFNFQLTVTLVVLMSGGAWLFVAENVLGFRLGDPPGSVAGYAWVIGGVAGGILLFLQPLVWVVEGAKGARSSAWYRYPLAIRAWKRSEAPRQG